MSGDHATAVTGDPSLARGIATSPARPPSSSPSSSKRHSTAVPAAAPASKIGCKGCDATHRAGTSVDASRVRLVRSGVFEGLDSSTARAAAAAAVLQSPLGYMDPPPWKIGYTGSGARLGPTPGMRSSTSRPPGAHHDSFGHVFMSPTLQSVASRGTAAADSSAARPFASASAPSRLRSATTRPFLTAARPSWCGAAGLRHAP